MQPALAFPYQSKEGLDVRRHLAQSTSALHADVDRRTGAFDLQTHEGLQSFLSFMHCGCKAVEDGLTTASVEGYLPEWPQRKRSHLLESDVPSLAEKRPQKLEFSGEAEIWGALYVLEGSRLGGRVISKSFPSSERSAFLADSAACRFWPQFLMRLEDADKRLHDRVGMTDGAHKAFRAFIDFNPVA